MIDCFAEFIGQLCGTRSASQLDCAKFLTVLLDHPHVVVGGDGRQSLRQQVIDGVASFDFHDVALFSKVFDVVDQQQLNAAMLAFGQTLEESGSISPLVVPAIVELGSKC